MATSTIERLLQDVGAVMAGHFLLASGRHSPNYLEKFRFLEYPEHTARLSRSIARYFKDATFSTEQCPECRDGMPVLLKSGAHNRKHELSFLFVIQPIDSNVRDLYRSFLLNSTRYAWE